jgi:hypothetical protein
VIRKLNGVLSRARTFDCGVVIPVLPIRPLSIFFAGLAKFTHSTKNNRQGLNVSHTTGSCFVRDKAGIRREDKNTFYGTERRLWAACGGDPRPPTFDSLLQTISTSTVVQKSSTSC